MNAREQPVTFDCAGEQLIGVLHRPGRPGGRGVVIVVGGPQTRVGSHRQFLLLARALAADGVPVLRFDYRGMGDSGGEARDFRAIEQDIAAAVQFLFDETPGLREVVLWGLCDAASAAMMYAYRDGRVTGLVLANPWIRSEVSMARTYLRHYYTARLFDRTYWRKLLQGQVELSSSFKSFLEMLRRALPGAAQTRSADGGQEQIPFPERMREGLEKFRGKTLLILSGDDLTAAEFKDKASASRAWRRVLDRASVSRHDYAEANHTFSSGEWRDQVTRWTQEWLASW